MAEGVGPTPAPANDMEEMKMAYASLFKNASTQNTGYFFSLKLDSASPSTYVTLSEDAEQHFDQAVDLGFAKKGKTQKGCEFTVVNIDLDKSELNELDGKFCLKSFSL